jgi:hypothetical protein
VRLRGSVVEMDAMAKAVVSRKAVRIFSPPAVMIQRTSRRRL